MLKLVKGHSSARTTEGYLASLLPMHFFDKGMPMSQSNEWSLQNGEVTLEDRQKVS